MPKRYLHGPMTWKVMQRNAWKDVANRRLKQLSNYTESQRHAWMIINSEKKMDQWENCPQFAHKLFWHVYTWHVPVDLIFYGQWTNLLVRSQNGQKHVTNDYLVWSLTFVTPVITGNSVMWETQHNNADLHFFKTPILQETLTTHSQHQVDFCALSEAEHLCQKVGCARNRPQFHTGLRKLK